MKFQFLFTTRLGPHEPVGLHDHPALEIVYYTGGRGTSAISGIRHRYGRGFFTIIPSGDRHDEKHDSRTSTICLGLKGSGLEPLRGCWRDTEGRLRRILEALLAEMTAARPGRETICQGLALQAAGTIERIGREKPAGRPRERRELVRQAIRIIRREEGRLSVQDLSQQLFISREYLRHLFQEHSTRSPMRHILEARLAKAKRLLRRTDTTIAEVAHETGIDNVFYFSRLFRQMTGRTPSSFRRGA